MPGRLARDIKQSTPFYSLRVEACLNLSRTADQINRAVATLLKPYDLSDAQYNVLRILRGAEKAEPGAGLPCNEIGRRLVTLDPDVTRLIDRLERRGLVARSREGFDRRVVTVRITDAGRERLASCNLDQTFDAAMAKRFAGLSDEQITTLIHLLEHLREHNTDTPESP